MALIVSLGHKESADQPLPVQAYHSLNNPMGRSTLYSASLLDYCTMLVNLLFEVVVRTGKDEQIKISRSSYEVHGCKFTIIYPNIVFPLLKKAKMVASSVRPFVFPQKSLKKERNVYKFCGKFVYLFRQNFCSDAAVQTGRETSDVPDTA